MNFSRYLKDCAGLWFAISICEPNLVPKILWETYIQIQIHTDTDTDIFKKNTDTNISGKIFEVTNYSLELQNSKFEKLMTSSLDDVIKIAKMTKIIYILDDVIALQ